MRVHARRYTVTESGTRHELPGGGLSADRVRELLKLVSNQTCGFVRVSYVNEQKAATKLRPIGSALYFLVTLQAPVKLHRIRNDQLYHYYRGDPLELLAAQARRFIGESNHRSRSCGGRARAVLHSRRHLAYRARDRTASLFFGRQHGMAQHDSRRCRAGRRRGAGEKVSTRGGRNSELSAAGLVPCV